jgi:sensor c-di-GMP phosphodiesterase-like protein
VHIRIYTIEWFSGEVLAKPRLTQSVEKQARDDEDNYRKEACGTETMRAARVSEMSDLDTREVGDMRSDAPMNVAVEMMASGTPTAMGETIFKRREKMEIGKRRSWNKAPASTLAPSDRESRMELTMQQQALELTQLP